MTENTLVEPVFLFPDKKKNSAELLLVFQLDGMFGVASLIISKDAEKGWKYRIGTFKNFRTIEISPKIDLFHGRITTPEVWRASVVICDKKRKPLILNWVAELNKKVKP